MLGLRPTDCTQLAPGHDPTLVSVKMRCYMEKQKNSRSLGKAASQAQGDKCSKLAEKGGRCFHLMSSGFPGTRLGTSLLA